MQTCEDPLHTDPQQALSAKLRLIPNEMYSMYIEELDVHRCRPNPEKMHFVLHLDVHRAHLDVHRANLDVHRESPRKNHAIDFPITTMSETFRRVPLVVTPSLLPETADTLLDFAKQGVDQGVIPERAAKRLKAKDDVNDSEASNLGSCSDDELSIEGNDEVSRKLREYYNKKKKMMKQKLLLQTRAQGTIELDSSNSSGDEDKDGEPSKPAATSQQAITVAEKGTVKTENDCSELSATEKLHMDTFVNEFKRYDMKVFDVAGKGKEVRLKRGNQVTRLKAIAGIPIQEVTLKVLKKNCQHARIQGYSRKPG